MDLSVVVLGLGMPQADYRLAGQPLVRHVLDSAAALEPVSLVVAGQYGAEQVPEAPGALASHVALSPGTGAGPALQQSMQAMIARGRTLLVLRGDMPLLRSETLRGIVGRHQAEGATVTVLEPRPESAKAGVLCFDSVWLWDSLHQLSEDDTGLDKLVELAGKGGHRFLSLPVPDLLELMVVNDQPKLAQAGAEVRRCIAEQHMRAGVALIHPETTYIDVGVQIGTGTTIWPNTYLQGETQIGLDCTIGPGSVIRSSSIGDRCKVELSVVEEAIMEEGSDIGPFGHLRKGAHLGPGVHMGNFGEVKNSYLGPGVAMGHMSYLGDATVGARVNIGAGTITCNYDGKNKHRTIIGEGAFIGSDSMLVAPVEVGAGAKTGAGSVVTRDVPPGCVVYGVPARIKPDPGVEGAGGE